VSITLHLTPVTYSTVQNGSLLPDTLLIYCTHKNMQNSAIVTWLKPLLSYSEGSVKTNCKMRIFCSNYVWVLPKSNKDLNRNWTETKTQGWIIHEAGKAEASWPGPPYIEAQTTRYNKNYKVVLGPLWDPQFLQKVCGLLKFLESDVLLNNLNVW